MLVDFCEVMEQNNILPPKVKDPMLKTYCPIVQKNGQRKFGPPLDWTGPPPPRGCEVFVGKIPRDMMEDNLLPVFSRVGKIYEMRLMIHFSGLNRGYAFVTYSNKSEADAAIRCLDGVQIKPGHRLGVVKSINNCRLFIGGLPKTKTREETIEELSSKGVLGIVDVIMYKNCFDKQLNRGYAFVEFVSHIAAATARRYLIPGHIKLWGVDVRVDWADPEPVINDERMAEVKVLYARNFQINTTPGIIKSFVESTINKEIDRVKKIFDYAFIHFYERADAELAMEKLQNAEIDGAAIEIKWAKPVNRELYKIQKLRKGNAKFNRTFNDSQTFILQKQYIEKKKCKTSSRHEASAAGEESGFSYVVPQDDHLPPSAKLDAFCKRYTGMLPRYSYQKYITTLHTELWVCSVNLPEGGQPLWPTNFRIGTFATRPCNSVQEAQNEAAQMALNSMMLVLPTKVQPIFASVSPTVPNHVNYTSDYLSYPFYLRQPYYMSLPWSPIWTA